jgi:hypothetical protein
MLTAPGICPVLYSPGDLTSAMGTEADNPRNFTISVLLTVTSNTNKKILLFFIPNISGYDKRIEFPDSKEKDYSVLFVLLSVSFEMFNK